jgi:hypothetical protein
VARRHVDPNTESKAVARKELRLGIEKYGAKWKIESWKGADCSWIELTGMATK